MRHKALVIGGWIAVAVLLALVFPQLETVVRQQSVNLIPRDAASFQTVDRMSAAFGEQGSKTMLVVAMEDPDGLTAPVRNRYEQLVVQLLEETGKPARGRFGKKTVAKKAPAKKAAAKKAPAKKAVAKKAAAKKTAKKTAKKAAKKVVSGKSVAKKAAAVKKAVAKTPAAPDADDAPF